MFRNGIEKRVLMALLGGPSFFFAVVKSGQMWPKPGIEILVELRLRSERQKKMQRIYKQTKKIS